MRRTSEERIQEWSEKIKNQQLSNKSREAWCKEQGISYPTFMYWDKKLNEQAPKHQTKTSFLEIPEDCPWIEVSLRGVKIAISKDFDQNALLYFFQLLKGK